MTARTLVWASFAAQAAFFASWIVAGALEPHYSHLTQYVSELAARTAAHPWIETAGIALLGLSLAALGLSLPAVLAQRQALPATVFVLAGVAAALAAAFPLDCGATADHHCKVMQDAGALSWEHYAHLWLGLAMTILLALTPFALARALWPSTAATVLLGAGATGVGLAVATTLADNASGGASGLIQRFGFVVVLAWVVLVGVWVLWATRSPRTSALIPMRPREFFARSWRGDGELVLRPFVVGRLFAQRVQATRESVWISDQTWRIDDVAQFGNGHIERRRMYCEFVSDDHVRLTADDLIDGADVWLEPDGFRLSEFRMAWPVGPFPVIVRCADRSYFDADGTFVNVIDLYSLGVRVPMARVTFWMRPVSDSPGGEDASAATRALV